MITSFFSNFFENCHACVLIFCMQSVAQTIVDSLFGFWSSDASATDRIELFRAYIIRWFLHVIIISLSCMLSALLLNSFVKVLNSPVIPILISGTGTSSLSYTNTVKKMEKNPTTWYSLRNGNNN